MCSQLVQFTLALKRYDNHHRYNKPQTGNRAGMWMTSCPEEMVLGIWKSMKKIQLSSDHGVEKLSSDKGVEKLGSDHDVEKLGPTMELKADIGPWRQIVEFSAVAAAVKFFWSRPSKMN